MTRSPRLLKGITFLHSAVRERPFRDRDASDDSWEGVKICLL